VAHRRLANSNGLRIIGAFHSPCSFRWLQAHAQINKALLNARQSNSCVSITIRCLPGRYPADVPCVHEPTQLLDGRKQETENG